MHSRESTRPFLLFFLLLPYGISTGFASITLPFFLTRAGFSVASAAAIVALGVSTNIWLFCWGPIVDLTLTPRRWYLLAVVVLIYSFFVGTGYAAYSALVVHAIGRGVASTKYALCQSLGNIPVAYMTAFNGWVHDRFGGVWMLNAEALLALVFVAAGLFALQQINARHTAPAAIRP